MVAWHRSRKADVGLRALGLCLCAVAYLAITRLIALQPALPEHAVDARYFMLATLGFLAASAGSAMACLGNHLFDQVEISARWGTGSAYLTSTGNDSWEGNTPPGLKDYGDAH